MGDADIALRTLAREYPARLVRALLPDIAFDEASLLETQLTARERRLDEAVRVVTGGQARGCRRSAARSFC